MPPMISIIGYSGSGKTTLIEKLIRKLKLRGYKIGTLKHASRGFNLDKNGTDSWRHKQAGADTVMIVSPGRIAMVKSEHVTDVSHLEPYFQDMDLVILEGYKKDCRPKIEIYRSADSGEILSRRDPNVIALVTDTDVDIPVPIFGLEEIDALVDWIENRFLEKSRRDDHGRKVDEPGHPV